MPDSHGTTIVNTRRLDATGEQIYAAFRDPERLRCWWGPQGFTSTFHEFDFRPGGAWRYTMHGPDGKDYYNECEFVALVPGRKVVILHLRPVHRFTLTVTLEPAGQQTQLTWRQHFDEPLASPELERFVTQANEQNLDRLAACLADPPR